MISGQVVAAHGRHFLVQTAQGAALDCITRGRKLDVVCGDRVELSLTAQGQGVIEKVLPRSSLFKRADVFRTKPIAANVTQVAIMVASRPSWSEDLLQRCLLAAESQHLPVLILANKADLPEHQDTLETLSLYELLGYTVISLCAKQDVAALRERLQDHLTLLAGQSGMGKSTLINALFPHADARVASFSEALDSGRHTTTHSRLYRLDESSAVIDSPGFQEFALAHLSPEDIEAAMPDFRPHLGRCRFRDCRHDTEPGCALRRAVEEGRLAKKRLDFFHRLVAENSR
ncbi:MAG: ribosome small subunit-dependent GTPase A [Pseudomonadota bacterium]